MTKREKLRAAVHERLVPYILALGFESTRTKAGKAAWPLRVRQGWGYARRRDDFVDRLDIYWEKYGRADFRLFFATCREAELDGEGLPASWASGSLHGRAVNALWPYLIPWQFLQISPNVDKAIEDAKRGLDDLEAFLRGRGPGTWVNVSQTAYGRLVPPPRAPMHIEVLTVLLYPLIAAVAVLDVILSILRIIIEDRAKKLSAVFRR
jgi:hypothetical protein